MRTCTHCKQVKAESQFYPHRDGLRGECKTCTARSKNPQARAYSRALRELRFRYPDEFDAIYQEQFVRVCREAS